MHTACAVSFSFSIYFPYLRRTIVMSQIICDVTDLHYDAYSLVHRPFPPPPSPPPPEEQPGTHCLRMRQRICIVALKPYITKVLPMVYKRRTPVTHN